MMLAAILKGKVSSRVERSEDLLTSVVFGILEHLQPEDGIGPLLELAAQSGEPGHLPRPASVEIEYWPWWFEDDQAHGAEPDVALWLTFEDGQRELVVVETKRGAGKSGEAERDQLARQAANGIDLARRSQAAFAGVIYLTDHLRRPRLDLDRSTTAMREHFDIATPPPLWWVSWRDLVAVLNSASRRPHSPLSAQARDAEACLRKWGLVWFTGVTDVPAPPSYTFTEQP